MTVVAHECSETAYAKLLILECIFQLKLIMKKISDTAYIKTDSWLEEKDTN